VTADATLVAPAVAGARIQAGVTVRHSGPLPARNQTRDHALSIRFLPMIVRGPLRVKIVTDHVGEK
jgi:hypothetical protein